MRRTIWRLEQAGSAISGVLMPVIMVIIAADALMRYWFNAPLQWAYDVVSLYLMSAATYPVASSTFRHGDHIAINSLRMRMSAKLRGRLDALVSVLALAVFGIIGLTSWGNVIYAFQTNELMPGYFNLPLWISHLPLAFGGTLISFRLALHAVVLLRDGIDPEVLAEGGHAE
jgi:TRAP-type C4-dicarboxylate transport system permease small subunit